MNRKRKGINAERELIHLFWATNSWVACRVASSGAIRYPAPDIIAGNATRKLAIECKSTGDVRQYVDRKQLEDLRAFAVRSGAEPWIAIRFPGKRWFFLSLEDLTSTPHHFGITDKEAEQKGLSFSQLVGDFGTSEAEPKLINESE